MLFMRNGVDPRAVGELSLYELTSMVIAFKKKFGKKTVTDAEMAEAEDLLRAVTVNDPNVRL